MSDWRDSAACVDRDPEDFFPNPIRNDRRHVEEVKALCRECASRADCLEDAIANADYWGIRGGYTGDEIQAIARRRGRTTRASRAGGIEHGTVKGYRQHARRGIPYCQDCRDAMAADKARQRREHGTPKGYRQHYRRGEPACGPCKTAIAAAQRARKVSA